MKISKHIDTIHDFLGLTGKLLNGVVNLLNTTLGNIGKILSTSVIIFTMYLVWRGFTGQIENIPSLPHDLTKLSPDDLLKLYEVRRLAYMGAIQSISGPLATLVGVVASVVGIGMTIQKFKTSTDNNGNVSSTVEDDNVVINKTLSPEPPKIPGENAPVTGSTPITY